MEQQCLGCSLAQSKLPVHKIYENDYISCFLDHDPYNEGHVLILPKAHIVEFDTMDEDTTKAVMDATKLISRAVKLAYQPDGITVCQNGGTFNELTHYHMHVVPRYEGDDFADFYNDVPLENDELKQKLPETAKVLSKVVEDITYNIR
ncbi:HIT family protein [Pontibacillus marinus]|uniref:HIT family hydrolase n=1 Tax=Pontibacillus marinus BH030004 = DSM 16465 TaxID=1385511 RepID=A0A0A5FZL4_9BACI|nr:HIT family protein [Pontibacillus marinus]KGX86276.1 HIT family hydrolase [Pontibacillus marinus BH030004 = DSM 16465]